MKFSTPIFIDRWLRSRDVVGPESTVSPLSFRSGVIPTQWFVNAQLGSDGGSGLDPRSPKQTLATLIGNGASSLAHSGDTIYVVGNITEEITAYNLLEDITIVGLGNRPRHADHARDYASYPTIAAAGISGCSWRQAASHGSTTPLLKIRGQGWRIENILFVPPSDAAAIYLDRNALSDVSEYDPSHLTVEGCRFAGGQSGIEDSGGCFNVNLKNCKFHGSTNGIKTLNTAVAVPLQWLVEDCVFEDNTNHIVVSASKWHILRCISGSFVTKGFDLTAVSSQGDLNTVFGCTLSGDYSSPVYRGGTNDNWAGNYSMDTAETEVQDNGLTTAIPA